MMRRFLITLAASSALLAVPALANAAPVHRTAMKIVCQFKRSELDATQALMKAGMTIPQLCEDKALTKAKPRSVSYGSCGESWIFNGKLGPGWVWEHYGARIWAGIRYGSASAHWYNYSTGGSNAFSDYIIPNVDWQTWDGIHHAYTRGGYIGVVLYASVITDEGYGCYNFSIAPWSFTWV